MYGISIWNIMDLLYKNVISINLYATNNYPVFVLIAYLRLSIFDLYIRHIGLLMDNIARDVVTEKDLDPLPQP